MKFINYLNEDKSPEEVLNILKNDCSWFLHFCNKNQKIFTRYYNKFPNTKSIEKFVPRKDRRPKDTNPIIHDLVDNLFKQKFGWKVRSEGVFTYPDTYANINRLYIPVFFAIGTFEVVYGIGAKYYDLYPHLNNVWDALRHNAADELPYMDDLSRTTLYLKKYLGEFKDTFETEDLPNFTSDKKLPAILTSECVFKCNAYYLVSPFIVKTLMQDYNAL